MENKQTAVEWFWNKIKSHFEHDGDLLESAIFTLAIAKQKEKQQIMDAFEQGEEDGYWHPENGYDKKFESSEQYYNETFKTEDNG